MVRLIAREWVGPWHQSVDILISVRASIKGMKMTEFGRRTGEIQPEAEKRIQEITAKNISIFSRLQDPTIHAYVMQWEDFNSRNPKDAIDRTNLKTTADKILELYY